MNQWWFKDAPGLWIDLYELTMAQAYWTHNINRNAFFEMTARNLPPDWGCFLMAGLTELHAYLQAFRFEQDDLDYLASTSLFDDAFLGYLDEFTPDVQIRAMPEGTLFFPDEPILEAGGPLIDVQLLESYALNIIGFSVIETTLAFRLMQAAAGRPVIDFGMRRAQGPVAALRAARGGQLAGFAATSNLYASRMLNMKPSGTMAHSFIEVHASEKQAYENFTGIYADKTILLVDTYDARKGIKMAAELARRMYDEKGVKLRGIRIDSGDLVALSQFARAHFKERGVDFLKIFVSSGLDEYRIAEMLDKGLQADGFGVGTSFAAAKNAPALDIVYKIIQYDGRGVYKKSPEKDTRPGRKTVLRQTDQHRFIEDRVVPFDRSQPNDLLVPFTAPETLDTIQQRLRSQLETLPDKHKQLKAPVPYPVHFDPDTAAP